MKAPNNDVTIAPNFQLRLQYFLNWCLTLHYYQFPLLPKRIIQIISLPNSQALFDGTNSIAKKRHGVTKQEIWLQHRVSAIGWLFTLGWPPFSSISPQIRVGQGQGLCFFPTCSIAQPDASSTSSEPVQASTGFFWVHIHVKRIHSVDKVHRKRIHFRGSADCRVYHHSQILYIDSADGEEHAASRSTRGSLMEH